MVSYMEIDPEKDKTNFDTLVDNRDFTVMYCWDPPSRFRIEDFQKKSFEEEKVWLRLQNLVLRMLACAVQWGKSHIGSDGPIRNGVDGEDASKPSQEVLGNLLAELQTHLLTCHEHISPPQYPLQGPYRTRVSTYLKKGHQTIFTSMIENVLYIGNLLDSGLEKIEEEKEEKLKTLVPSLLEELFSTTKSPLLVEGIGQPSISVHVLEECALAAETLSHVTILAGVCNRLLKPLKAALSKKNKKKKDTVSSEPLTFVNFNTLVEKLLNLAPLLHQQVRDVDPVYLAWDLSTMNLSRPLMEDKEEEVVEKIVWSKVAHSYQQSAREIGELIHTKMQYLNTLLV